jgi:ubiquinone/menaquinone biosynthesis C-methylase UbiE
MKNASLKKLYNNESEVYDEKRFSRSPGKVRHAVQIKVLKRLLKDNLGELEGKEILEIGVGTGRVAVELAAVGVNMHGLDLAAKMLKVTERKAKERGVDIELKQGSGERILFRKKFDAIIIIHVLGHVNDPLKIFKEARKSLKDGGILIFDFYNADNSFVKRGEKKNRKQELYNPRSLSIDEVRRTFGEIGFVPTQYMLTFKWLPYLVYYTLEKIMAAILPPRFARNIIYCHIKGENHGGN